MIEKTVIDYLAENLIVNVYAEKFKQAGKFVIVEKVGGGENNHIKRASIAVQSYADTMYEAAELNEEVKRVMERITELPTVSKCKLDSDYNYTDTSQKKYRYQSVFDFIYN